MIAVSTVVPCYDLAYLDLDRCELIPEVVDDSTPYPENEPCSEDCYLTQVDPCNWP